MPQVLPRSIVSPQQNPYTHLRRVVGKHIQTHYRRPYREHNVHVFERISALISENPRKELILDSCCGTGLSTQKFAERYPNSLIIGIDQSASRLERRSELFERRAEKTVCCFVRTAKISGAYVLSTISFLIGTLFYIRTPIQSPSILSVVGMVTLVFRIWRSLHIKRSYAVIGLCIWMNLRWLGNCLLEKNLNARRYLLQSL